MIELHIIHSTDLYYYTLFCKHGVLVDNTYGISTAGLTRSDLFWEKEANTFSQHIIIK